MIDATVAVVVLDQPHDYGYLPVAKMRRTTDPRPNTIVLLPGGAASTRSMSHPPDECRPLDSSQSRFDSSLARDGTEGRLETGRSLKVVGVFPEPTSYRAPLFDLIAAQPGIDLFVGYAARAVAGRTWDVQLSHPHVFLRGFTLPGARRVLRHDYPVTPSIFSLLERCRPDVVVVSVEHVWRTGGDWLVRRASGAVRPCGRKSRLRPAPSVAPCCEERRRAQGRSRFGGRAGEGSLVRSSMVARGARPDRIEIFANTIDVHSFGEHADTLRSRRSELRDDLGIQDGEVVVVCVARLIRDKALDLLIRAAATAGRRSTVLWAKGRSAAGSRRSRLSWARASFLSAPFRGEQM